MRNKCRADQLGDAPGRSDREDRGFAPPPGNPPPFVRARRRIGTVAAVRAVDCGGDSGMPNAETYELRLAIRSRVVAGEGGGSLIQTTVEGTGRNATTAAASEVRCSSKGAVEQRLVELVRAAVSGKP